MYQQTDISYHDASILIVGLGALGSAAALALAATRPGQLCLVDNDRVETSNLQRQVLFGPGDIGRPKAEAAHERLATECRSFDTKLDASNCLELFEEADFVIDATDDPRSKWLINHTALLTSTPYCHAGVVRNRGQVMAVLPGLSACLECVFGNFGDFSSNADCSSLGILAPVAGLIGTLEALSAVGHLTADPAFRAGRMLTYELGGQGWRQVDFQRVAGCVCDPARKQDPSPGEQATCLS